MYYEGYKGRHGKSRRKNTGVRFSLMRSLFKLLLFVILVTSLALGAFYAIPVSFFINDENATELSMTAGLPQDHVNILLIGCDVESDGLTRSDTIMIASVGYNDLKVISILRDTLVEIPGYGRRKINAAYAYGGVELLMRTINENFSLNINKYIKVDFVSLVRIVDALGGVELDVTKEEMEQVNQNVHSSGKVFAPLGYTETPLEKYGESTHVNGLQALGYARIRKLDSDFVRTSRQRELVSAMLSKIMRQPYRIPSFAVTVLNEIETDLTVPEMLCYGMKILFSGGMKEMRLPVDGSYTDNSSSLEVTDFAKNTEAFIDFVYGTGE